MSDRGQEEALAELYYGTGSEEPETVLHRTESPATRSGISVVGTNPTNGGRRPPGVGGPSPSGNPNGRRNGAKGATKQEKEQAIREKWQALQKAGKLPAHAQRYAYRPKGEKSTSQSAPTTRPSSPAPGAVPPKRPGNTKKVPSFTSTSRGAQNAAHVGRSIVDAQAHVSGSIDALREMQDALNQERQDAADKKEEEKKAKKEAEKEALRQEFLERMGGLHYWYEEDVPFSRMFILFFFIIFAISLFSFGDGTESGSNLESLWKWFIVVLGSCPLPGPLPFIITFIDYLVVSFQMYDVLLLSISWAGTGAFLADFTYCLFFNKRFFLWPKSKHEYFLIKTFQNEETEQDLRADSNGRGDNKHLNCFYAEIRYVYTLGLYYRVKNFRVSMEVLAQLTGPRIMNLLTDDDMVLQKLVAAGGALDTVNINRAIVFGGINIVSNTEQLAYGFYRHFRRNASEVPFGRAPLHQH